VQKTCSIPQHERDIPHSRCCISQQCPVASSLLGHRAERPHAHDKHSICHGLSREELLQPNAENMALPSPDSAEARSNIHRDLSPGFARRQLSRSPHPYRRRKAEPSRWQEPPGPGGSCSDVAILTPSPYPSDQGSGDEATRGRHDRALPQRDYRSLSDSGTEADDESYTFLKGLPAPPVKPRKGLRNSRGEGIERSLTPPHLRVGGTKDLTDGIEGSGADRLESASVETEKAAERTQRIRWSELVRRVVEFGLLACIGALLLHKGNVLQALANWHKGTKLLDTQPRRCIYD
jgi:hypothetical protein